MAREFDIFPADAPRARCADPVHLAVVDAAFDRPGGPAAAEMRDRICAGCPIGEECLAWGMRWREDGIWGGFGPNARTGRGAPPQGSLRLHRRGSRDHEYDEGNRARCPAEQERDKNER